MTASKAAETRRSKRLAKNRDDYVNIYRFTRIIHAPFSSKYNLFYDYEVFDRRETILPDAISEVIEGSRFEDGDGFDLHDTAVWLADRLVAVIRLGKNGDPVVTMFDNAE